MAYSVIDQVWSNYMDYLDMAAHSCIHGQVCIQFLFQLLLQLNMNRVSRVQVLVQLFETQALIGVTMQFMSVNSVHPYISCFCATEVMK